MRLVPINSIKEGSFLAKAIYDSNGRVLLAKGFKLTEPILNRIELSGVMSLYINDEYSDNEIEDVIKPELRQKAITTIRTNLESMLKHTQQMDTNSKRMSQAKDSKLRAQYVEDITKLATEIVEELAAQKDILINLVDIKSMDNYTYEHSINVTLLALILGIELKYDKKRLTDLAVGTVLHDLGKVFMPKDILLKNGKLTDKEFEIIKQHPVNGYEYIKKNMDISILSRNIVLQHHERVDGKGYPDGIKGDKLHEYVKIAAIADVYDALTSDRPYRRAMSPNEAIEYLMGAADRHFDFDMVRTFVKKIVPYPVGTLVRLSNGYVAVVEDINPGVPLLPKVKLVGQGGDIHIDLTRETNIVIEGVQYEVPKS